MDKKLVAVGKKPAGFKTWWIVKLADRTIFWQP